MKFSVNADGWHFCVVQVNELGVTEAVAQKAWACDDVALVLTGGVALRVGEDKADKSEVGRAIRTAVQKDEGLPVTAAARWDAREGWAAQKGGGKGERRRRGRLAQAAQPGVERGDMQTVQGHEVAGTPGAGHEDERSGE
jgi:hypothetical protein